MQHGGEMTRLELERAPDVLQAFLVPAEKVVKRSALVPRLGIERCAAQERGQPRFGDVVTTRGDVAGCRVERRRGGAVRMVHPDVPDLVLGVERLGCRAGAQPLKKLTEFRQVAGRTAAAPSGDEAEDVRRGAGHVGRA